MIQRLFVFIACIICCCSVRAQKIAELTVPATTGVEIPLEVDLDALTVLPDSVLGLVEVTKGSRTSVPFQIENKGRRQLHWIVAPGPKRTFELVKTNTQQTASNPMNVSRDTGALVIASGNHPLVQYNYKMHYPPPGVDTAFKRSGYIHPLYTPHGQPLTRIGPSDHYHHYGLWNPWTKVLFEGQVYDLWNLKDRKGTVKFAGFVAVNEGPVYGDYQVRHEHVVFKKDGTEKTAMDELQSVRVYQPENGKDYYIMDITIQLNDATESEVVLEEYRYAGLGWRATEKWTKDNSEVLTSEGKTRKDADGSKARWCIVQGSLDSDYGGAVMMSYPTNYNFPEPLRIWPENIMPKGDMYAMFAPTKDKDWRLVPGHNYVLKYRFLVFNGKYSAEKAEAAWKNFAHPPVVTVKKIN